MFKVVLYKNAYGYSIPCANKRENLKTYMNAKFYDCTPPDNNCEVYINEGGFGCYKNKNGNTIPTVIIKDYTIVRVFEDNATSNDNSTIYTRTNSAAYKADEKQSVGKYETGTHEDGIKHIEKYYNKQIKGQITLEEVDDDDDLPF